MGGATSIRVDGWDPARLVASTESALDLAMLRAYPTERSMDYGCSLEDVLKLQRRVQQGAGWVNVASLLASDDLARAQAAREAGAFRTAATFYQHAAACLRLAQAALEEHPDQRLATYRDNVDAFSDAMRLCGLAEARFEVLHQGAKHGAWLFQPAYRDTPPPCVLVVGGADGWCEAFYGSVPAFLERGLAVCLLELPGQGLARLQHASYLDRGFTRMISATLNALAPSGIAPGRFGILGHSMGGSLALRAAADDDRLRACATNGGSVELAQGMRKFPRVLRRLGRMMGKDCPDDAVLGFIEQLDLATVASTLSIPVLCLQGGQDPIVSDEEARQLGVLRGTHPFTYEYWPEGTHCLYNHSVERNAVVADWFACQLGPLPF
jgi:alpha-beta hydrolase superfamily lysophospholipase